MKIIKTQTGPIQTNTYLFECGDAVAVVDPGAESSKILALADNKFNKPIKFVLLTHAHWDHVGAVIDLQKQGAKVYMHEDDMQNLERDFIPDVLLKGGEELSLGNQTISVLHTPGHTAGSVVYKTLDTIFSGDTLFRREIGRCDFPTGNFNTMKKTLAMLFALKGDYRVLPGHGEETTLESERKENPYR